MDLLEGVLAPRLQAPAAEATEATTASAGRRSGGGNAAAQRAY